MRIASLDLGSNTFLMLVADFQYDKLKEVIRDEARTTRLGQGVHKNREFHPDALLRAEECFSEYSEIIKALRPDKVVAMATSAARDVKNGDALFSLGDKYGIPIQIIPGSQEAQISFEGSTFDLPNDRNVVVIDVGGGSTEVVGKDSDGNLHGHSLDIGSVRLTEMFVSKHPVSKEEILELEKYCEQTIQKHRDKLPQGPIRKLVAVAGTPVTLSLLLQKTTYTHEVVHGFQFNIKQLREVRDMLAAKTVEERKELTGMEPKRADVIVAGTTILLKTAEALGVDTIQVSNHGVRYGIAHLAAREEC